jgi:putative heme utilization carrier protein HutX
MSENKGVATIMAAREMKVSEREVLKAIPDEAFETSASHFEEIMKEMTEWGEMTIIVTNGSVIFEVKSSVPKGSFGRGFYNLHEKGNCVGGHLMAESFDSIFFVDRPFMGQESLSIQIYDKDGNASIKFYLGRDENRKIKQEQKEKFLELRKRFMQ